MAAITIISAITFFSFLGKVHLFDWDEINFAECAREMLVSGNYAEVQLNFQPFWEKPPLFIWLQAISMQLFGVNEFAARFPNALCGVITLNLLYFIGTRIYSRRFGIFWVLCYGGSLLPHLYFKSGIIDPWFNLFIFLGIWNAIRYTNNQHGKYGNRAILASGFFIGLSVLTKGPVGLLIFGLTAVIWWVFRKFKTAVQIRHILLFLGAFFITGLSWFGIMAIQGKAEIIGEFISYQIRLFNTNDADHGGIFFYHFIVLLIGCFPASIFFLQSFKKLPSDTPFQLHVKGWMSVLFWTVLLLFSIVKTKIVHYSSMCYFPLTYLAAWSLLKLTSGEIKLKKYAVLLFLLISFSLSAVISAIPLFEKIKPFILSSGIIKDQFATEAMQEQVFWHGWEWLIGLLFFISGSSIMLYAYRNKKQKTLSLIFTASIPLLFLLLVVIIPKIERFSQGAAIDYFKNLSGQNVYTETIMYKSYAYLFYGNKQPELNTPEMLNYISEQSQKDVLAGHSGVFNFNTHSMNWMLIEKIDRPACFACKVNHVDEIKKVHPDLRELYRKNGFVFLIRHPSKLKN